MVKQKLPSVVSRALSQLTEKQLTGLIEVKKLNQERTRAEENLRRMQADIRGIQAHIDALDRKAKRILRESSPRVRTGKKGPWGKGPAGQTMPEALLAALAKAKKPLSLSGVAQAILDAGYKTRSAFGDFRTNVAHALRRLKGRVVRNETGWVLKDGR